MKRLTPVALAFFVGAGLWAGSSINAQGPGAAPAAQGRGGAAPAMAAALIDPHEISGFWGLGIDGRRVPPANLLPTITKAKLDASAKKDAHNIRWCNLAGVPAIMDMGRPLDIRQGVSQIILTSEVSNVAPRYIYTKRTTHISPDVFDPSTNGDSIAHWEGDSLLVETVGFHETHGLMAIPGGGYRTANAKLVERYTLLDNGNTLSVVFTWTDNKMFRTPHTYEFRVLPVSRPLRSRVAQWLRDVRCRPHQVSGGPNRCARRVRSCPMSPHIIHRTDLGMSIRTIGAAGTGCRCCWQRRARARAAARPVDAFESARRGRLGSDRSGRLWRFRGPRCTVSAGPAHA